MFINVNGPPLDEWEPINYVSRWLVNHQNQEKKKRWFMENNLDYNNNY